MPSRNFRAARPAGRSQRRKLVWATLDQSVTIPAGQISNVNLLAALSVAGSSLLGVTVGRTHIRIQATTATAGDLVRIGLVIGRATDVGINIPGQQDPANPELDWMLLDRRAVQGQETNVAGKPCYSYDLRSKRKMQELNQAYVLALQDSGAASSTWQLWARTLVMLP